VDLLNRFIIWSEKSISPLFDALRILLGTALIFKALAFLSDITYLANILSSDLGFSVDSGINAMTVAHVIAILQLITGIFILFGIATRLACLFQIPVVLVAVFFVVLRNPSSGSDLLLSIGVLMLLILFLIKGSGRLSLHYFLFL